MGLLRAFFAACMFFTSVSGLAAPASSCTDLFTQAKSAPTLHLFQASHTLSQVVRDNAFDYWFWSKRNAPSYFGKELAQEGLVVGDTHPGNFILAPLHGRIRFYIADLKDAGEAPLILDFARLAMSTQAIYRRVEDRLRFSYTLEKLFDAYIDGLQGELRKAPKVLKSEFKTTLSDYEDLAGDYVDRHTEEDRFKFKAGKIAPFTSKSTGFSAKTLERVKHEMSEAALQVHPRAKVLDFAVRVRDRGGSKNSDRYWLLIRSRGENEIVEFKENEDPAVSQYQDQEDVVSRYATLMMMFWGEKDKSIHLTSIDGRSFLMRPKKIEIFSVPYKPKDDETQEELLSIASYDANYVGLIHGRQLKDDAYITKLKKNKKQILESIKSFSKDYLDRLESRAEDLL